MSRYTIIKYYCGHSGESVTSGLVWSEVAAAVGTRSEKQCRCKWLNHLNWRQCGGTEWNRQDSIMLIEK